LSRRRRGRRVRGARARDDGLERAQGGGHVLSLFGHQAWGFLRDAWDKVLEPAFSKVFHFTVTAFKDLWSKVLKPAWAKFNKWIDRAHDWLVTKFGPILCWLQKARKRIEAFYKKYVQPWLDAIDTTRKFLRLLEALHIKWAAELDRKLAALEDRITRPFLLVVGKLNEIINLVNSVIDGFGLFQRVVLIRSIERDYQYAWRAIVNPYSDSGRRTRTRDARNMRASQRRQRR
jgi:hypothetical protein